MNEKFKKFIKKEWYMLLVIAANFTAGLSLGPRMPERVPIHWNVQGQIDNYGSKGWAVFGIPCTILGIYLLMLILPKVDPKKNNYNLFEGTYKVIRVLLLLVFSAIYAVTTAATIGVNIKIDVAIPVIIAIMFMILGNYMGKVRQNFFVGVKTPWTLSDPEIWTKTHRLTGKLWTIGGILLIVASLLLDGTLKFITFMAVILSTSFYPILYSYLLFRKKKEA